MPALYKKCPKCGAATGGSDTCPACGLIFAKYLKAKFAPPQQQREARRGDFEEDESLASRIQEAVLYVPADIDVWAVYARAALLAAIACYGLKLALMDIPSWEMASSLIHLPMVPIHEFGHLLFRPFGEFMMLLGGSLFQVLLPVAFGVVFLTRNRDPFAAAVMVWWAAVALMDIAPYIYDAWEPRHVLLTGRTGDTGAHDFIDTLGDLGLLHRAQPIGRAVHALGVLIMLGACAWAALLLSRQYAARRL